MTLMFADFFKSLIPNLNIQPLDGLLSQVKEQRRSRSFVQLSH